MRLFSIVFLCVMWVFSCGRKQESNSISSPESRTFILERENFFNSLKNQEDVSNLISTVDYKSDFLNDPNKYYQYTSNSIKAAANLGVYISNLNYCIVFKEKEAIKKYFNASYELSKAIQIEQSFLEFLMKRYETNIEQNDSVKVVIHQLFNQATAGLKDTDRERLAGIAMAGYQLENLHLLLSTLASLPDKLTPQQSDIRQQILQYIFEYQGKFEVIYQFIRANSDPLDPDKNPNYPFFDNGLRELIDVFRSISQQDPQLDNLTEKVNALRNGIVIP
jgi:translation initiation factor 2 beta subunit (eIF-2beta)/eIF-5